MGRFPRARVSTALFVVSGLLLLVTGGALFALHRDMTHMRAENRASALRAVEAANGLASRIQALEVKDNAQLDPTVIAKKVEGSVFVIETDGGLGSAWVVASTGESSTLVTNFHVIADTWNNGGRAVSVKQHDRTYPGTISQVDIPNDLALVTTPEQFPPLARAKDHPQVGDPVLVIGAPLGLSGTVTSGIVSALRTEEGRDYLQFSAPISPGNSGGPVVDRAGAVLGIAEAKIVATGAEGLSLAIPVSKLCTGLAIC